MAQCAVCGVDRNLVFRSFGRFLCLDCSRVTPNKVSRHEFALAYWGDGYEAVHPAIRREFYEDYVVSTYDVDQYIRATSHDYDAA